MMSCCLGGVGGPDAVAGLAGRSAWRDVQEPHEQLASSAPARDGLPRPSLAGTQDTKECPEAYVRDNG
jgi:hypothetical protein